MFSYQMFQQHVYFPIQSATLCAEVSCLEKEELVVKKSTKKMNACLVHCWSRTSDLDPFLWVQTMQR